MSIPDFNEHGLLPAGVFDCTLDEIEAMFCFNGHRTQLLGDLRRFLAREWAPWGFTCPLYIDGSFVRNKMAPSDIDIVFDATQLPPQGILATFDMRFRSGYIKSAYNVDVWVRHPMIPNDLTDFFQYVGDKAAAELHLDCKEPKGILRVQI